MKSYQYRNFDISENILYSSSATVTFMFLVNDTMVWRNSFTSTGTMVHVMHVHFMFFTAFKNLKSSWSEYNMQGHALDIFIENANKMVWVIPLNAKNED